MARLIDLALIMGVFPMRLTLTELALQLLFSPASKPSQWQLHVPKICNWICFESSLPIFFYLEVRFFPLQLFLMSLDHFFAHKEAAFRFRCQSRCFPEMSIE